MKRFFIGLFVGIFCIFYTFGEESPKNKVYGGITFILRPGFNIGYERALNDKFSMALDVNTDVLFPLAVEITARWYPASNGFFAGFGSGVWMDIPMFFLSPGIGWKINLGTQNKWVLIPSLTGRILWQVNTDFHPRTWFSPLVRANLFLGYRF